MSSMNYLFSIITLIMGGYGLYMWISIRRTGDVPVGSILLPRDRTLSDCIDEEEFLSYIRPRLLIFSVLIFLYGVFCAVDTAMDLIGQWVADMSGRMADLTVQGLTCVLPMSILIWFALTLNKIQKELWN